MTRFFVAVIAALSSASAFALEDIVVTAERREASIQDVPLAVTALSTEELANFQVNDAQDLQRYVPSLNMFNNIVSPTNLSLSMRGGLQQDASLVVAESPVGIYVDDIYVGRLNGNNVTLSDIERVEVLRGPQGTLYGRNTGYGAVKYISRTPGDEFWFDAAAGAGNYDQGLIRGSLGGPLSDTFSGSLAGQWRTKDGQYRNLAEDRDVGLVESYALRGKLRYTGSDVFDALLSVSLSNAETDSIQLVNGVTPNDPDEESTFTTGDLVFPNGEFTTNTPWNTRIGPDPIANKPSGETEQTIVGLTLTFDINDDLTFKSITGYVGLDDFFSTDFSGNSVNPFTFVGAADIESDQFTQELQLLGTAFDDRMNYLVGAFYLTEDAQQAFGWNFNGPLSQSLIQTEVESIALFGEATFQFTDKLSGTLGLRWTEDSKDFEFDFECLPGGFFCGPGFTDRVVFNDETFDEWTPRIGIDYAATDNVLLYAQAARGFKSGGFSAIALASTDPVGVYGPETNWTYEGGLKADWFDNRLRTNLAYFFSDIKDIQQNSTAGSDDGSFEFPVQNSGDSEIQGLEFEIVATPLDGLNLFLTGSLLDGEYTFLAPGSAPANSIADFGVDTPRTPQTPDYSINIGFDYGFEVPGDLFGYLSFGADLYKIDNYVTAATNEFRNSGWEQWNAYVAVDLGESWSVRLAGKNLADEFIITSGSRGLGGLVSLPPREVLFTVDYRYGGR